jgi:hypothetical protein
MSFRIVILHFSVRERRCRAQGVQRDALHTRAVQPRFSVNKQAMAHSSSEKCESTLERWYRILLRELMKKQALVCKKCFAH